MLCEGKRCSRLRGKPQQSTRKLIKHNVIRKIYAPVLQCQGTCSCFICTLGNAPQLTVQIKVAITYCTIRQLLCVLVHYVYLSQVLDSLCSHCSVVYVCKVLVVLQCNDSSSCSVSLSQLWLSVNAFLDFALAVLQMQQMLQTDVLSVLPAYESDFCSASSPSFLHMKRRCCNVDQIFLLEVRYLSLVFRYLLEIFSAKLKILCHPKES